MKLLKEIIVLGVFLFAESPDFPHLDRQVEIANLSHLVEQGRGHPARWKNLAGFWEILELHRPNKKRVEELYNYSQFIRQFRYVRFMLVYD